MPALASIARSKARVAPSLRLSRRGRLTTAEARYSVTMEPLTPEAWRLAAIVAVVVVLWFTEALPLAVTALLGAAACVALGVAPAK